MKLGLPGRQATSPNFSRDSTAREPGSPRLTRDSSTRDAYILEVGMKQMGVPNTAPPLATMFEGGNHTLVSSARAVGEATAVLPVVSTLSFGFAVSQLLIAESMPPAVRILLSVSAACSTYTTTFSVLEFYYVNMLTASDQKSHYYTQITEDDSLDAEFRDTLAQEVDEVVTQFEPWRKLARTTLWLSVVFILAAAATKTGLQTTLGDWKMMLSVVVLALGIMVVPTTVYFFRKRFTPLIQRYPKRHTNVQGSPFGLI